MGEEEKGARSQGKWACHRERRVSRKGRGRGGGAREGAGRRAGNRPTQREALRWGRSRVVSRWGGGPRPLATHPPSEDLSLGVSCRRAVQRPELPTEDLPQPRSPLSSVSTPLALRGGWCLAGARAGATALSPRRRDARKPSAEKARPADAHSLRAPRTPEAGPRSAACAGAVLSGAA